MWPGCSEKLRTFWAIAPLDTWCSGGRRCMWDPELSLISCLDLGSLSFSLSFFISTMGTMINWMCDYHEHQMRWDVKWGTPTVTADKKPATKMLFGVLSVYLPPDLLGLQFKFLLTLDNLPWDAEILITKDALSTCISLHPGFLHQGDPTPWVGSHPVTPLLSQKKSLMTFSCHYHQDRSRHLAASCMISQGIGGLFFQDGENLLEDDSHWPQVTLCQRRKIRKGTGEGAANTFSPGLRFILEKHELI